MIPMEDKIGYERFSSCLMKVKLTKTSKTGQGVFGKVSFND
jgi:hypothetical protein